MPNETGIVHKITTVMSHNQQFCYLNLEQKIQWDHKIKTKQWQDLLH